MDYDYDHDNGVVCRLCDKPSNDLINIFEEDTDGGVQIIQHIKKCFSIVIYRSDPLSKFICMNCFANVAEFSEFKNTVANTVIKQQLRLEDVEEPSDSIQLFMNSVEQHESDTSALFEIPRSDQSTSTEDFYPGKIHDGDSLLDVDCNSYTDNENVDNNMNGHLEDSDMDIEDDTDNKSSIIDDGSKKRLRIDNYNDFIEPVQKRRKLIGPKSEMESAKLSNDPSVKITKRIYYKPHSLLQSCLNIINSENIEDYHYECCKKMVEIDEERVNYCRYCKRVFEDDLEYVKHESCGSLQLSLPRVDDLTYWSSSHSHSQSSDTQLRNRWLRTLHPTADIRHQDDTTADNLLVPVTVTAGGGQQQQLVMVGGGTGQHHVGSVVTFVDSVPYINGRRLMDLSRDDRLYVYQTIRVQNQQRKFCTLCRFTFKDNWAMDKHYYSLACLYTCRYCGRRFNKMRQVFDAHIQSHILFHHTISTKIFSSNRRNDPTPRFINPAYVTFLSPQNVNQKKIPYNNHSNSAASNYHLGRWSTAPVQMPNPHRVKQMPLSNQQVQLRDFDLAARGEKAGGRVRRALGRPAAAGGGRRLGGVMVKEEPVDLGGCEMEQEDLVDDDEEQETSSNKPPPLTPVTFHSHPSSTPPNTSQAYFCKKCYKVFFALDEYNVHTTVCVGGGGNNNNTGQQQQGNVNVVTGKRMYVRKAASEREKVSESGTEEYSPTGRPVRHCVKEVRTYSDDIDRISPAGGSPASGTPGRFDCGICSSVFPTIHSRNSHMRIHKAGYKSAAATATSSRMMAAARGGGGGSLQQTGVSNLAQKIVNRHSHMRKAVSYKSSVKSHTILKSKQASNLAQKIVNSLQQQKQQIHRQQAQLAKQHQLQLRQAPSTSTGKYPRISTQHIKEEPMDMEPLVEIHEDDGPAYPSSIGSVSITPITSSRQSSHPVVLNRRNQPDIMKLVQNNPHLTIKPKQQRQQQLQNNYAGNSSGSELFVDPNIGGAVDPDKCYRCSSCSKPFANKSHLYFHKKNQCGGSKYPCPFCKKRFGTEAAYSSHIFYSHPV